LNRDSGTGRPALKLQVTLILLTALLPIVWLIGRRTAPAAIPTPLLLGGSEARLELAGGRPGLGAARPPEVALPAGPGGTVLMVFPPPEGGAPPYQLGLTGPDGGITWQIVWPDLPAVDGWCRLAMPASLLRSGRHSLVVRDASGTVTSMPFLVR